MLTTQHVVDMTDTVGLKRAVQAAAPDLVFHLAAQASVGHSWADPDETYMTNVLGQVHLLEAIRALGAKPRVLIASSAEVYGVPDVVPIPETAPLRPGSPYAVTKATQDLMGYQYFVAYGLPVVRTRAFNHLGPGQALGFAAPDFAQQIAQVEAGLHAPVIAVGNLSAERDLSDVRDVVRAYYWVLRMGKPGEAYNVGRGSAVPIRYVLDTLLAQSTASIEVRVDPARQRPSDAPRIYADITKLRQATGWAPETPLEQSLIDVLEYWRTHVRVPRS